MQVLTDQELEQIIRGCMAGRPDAQHALYIKYQRLLFGVCLRYAQDFTEAEDMAQDGFVKIFQKVRQYKFEGSFEGWMRRVMVNTALERLRKKKLLYVDHDLEGYDSMVTYENAIDHISVQDLLGLIHELSPQYRTVFNLYAIDGFSHKEISEMLRISEGTSKSNLSRARQILQDQVRKYFDHTSDGSRNYAR